MNPSISVAVIGARGYSGLELCRLLLRHPFAQIKAISSTESFSLADEIPMAREIPWKTSEDILRDPPQLLFLATPPETSLELAARALASGSSVIDLSGAFRLKTSDYATWYKTPHSQPGWLQKASYGLSPFACPVAHREPVLIANPGCYATAILMALIPLLKDQLIDPNHIVIDAKSGATGAGRKGREDLLFSEIAENFSAYRVGRHQHLPEIRECVQNFCGVDISPAFSTHLLPIRRGLMASLYLQTKSSKTEIRECYERHYAHYPFVRMFTEIEKGSRLDRVVGTPNAHLSFDLVGPQLYVFSVLDNLLKGAASQALENFNKLYDFPIATGIST